MLEGGGMRGMFTCGVTDVFMEHGIRFDGIVGVSAGAAFGCNFKSGQKGRAIRYSSRFMSDPRYMSWWSFLRTGNLFSTDFCYHEVPTVHDPFDAAAFKKNPMPFYLVCTDVESGEPVYHQLQKADYEGLEWIRATASLPIVSTPVELEGRKLLDGGLTDSIPLKFFQELGYERNVVILTQPQGYLKRRTKLMPLFHLFMRRYPQVIKLMRNRHHMYNSQLKYILEQQILGNALLIYPEDELPVSRTTSDKDEMRMVYEMGRKKGEAMLPQVTRFLAGEDGPSAPAKE